MTYHDFLREKIDLAPESGFTISPEDVNPALKPHQRDAVIWAVRGGRRALFESFGLGKTAQQLEFCRIVTEHEGGQALIVLPLGVKQEFTQDAVKLLGMDPPPYVRNMAEIRASDAKVMVTNYERVRDGDIDPTYFTATSLDEASVLRSFGSDTYQTFLPKFKGVRYKLVCTATPSPNRYKELSHYAAYLEIMDSGQVLTRFFQRDSTKANNLTLYPHREADFWLWMSSWALFITKPSDLGYDDTGYDLPPLEIRKHKIDICRDELPEEKDGQVKLFREASISLPDAAREKNESIAARVAKARELIDDDPDAHFILWHDLEAERHALKKAIPETVEIYGSQAIDERESRTIGFANGEYRILATKKSLSGSGCNFQRHCHRAIFVGIDYNFNDFIQAIHRVYRFLQSERVIIDILYTDAEQEILRKLLEKWENHNYMTEQMTAIVKKYGLAGTDIADKLARSLGVERRIVTSDTFTAVHSDCVLETESMPENSVDLIVTSIPFSNQYEYSPNYSDFGHNENTAKFFEQMDYLSPNLLRTLKPGRVFCCHVKDLMLSGAETGKGFYTVEPFHAMTIQHYIKHGFHYMGMITIVTDVVRENAQTYRLGWSLHARDTTPMSVGCPEYVLLFRKSPTDTSKSFADVPVTRPKDDYTRAQWQIDAHGYWRSSGNRPVDRRDLENVNENSLQKLYHRYSRENTYDYGDHVALAENLNASGRLPSSFMVLAPGSWRADVWDDINRMRTLNTSQSQKRKEKHVCPLQFDTVERLIAQYSAEGETVFDPFAGLFTVPERAVRMGRKGYGIELSPGYFKDGLDYLQAAEAALDTPSLFDLTEDAQ